MDTCDNWCSCQQPHYIAGQLDAVIGDIKDRLFVYERKTYGARPNIERLNRNWQFKAYDWILTQSTKLDTASDLHGSEVAGILYDGLWKRTGQEPSFKPTPRKTVPDTPPKYTTDQLFLRHYMTLNPESLDEFALDLKAIVEEIANPLTRRTVHIPFLGCSDCHYTAICDAMTQGEDTDYIIERNFTKRERTPAFKDFYDQDEDP